MINAWWILFVAGAIVCLANTYLALIRYPVHRISGRSKESFIPITGWPFVGLTALWSAQFGIEDHDWTFPTAVILTLLDLLSVHLFGVVSSLGGQPKKANKAEMATPRKPSD